MHIIFCRQINSLSINYTGIYKKEDYKNMEQKIQLKEDSSLSQQCYEHIQHDIIEGVLRPGKKLKVMSIAEHFNIGQSPVREALSRLAACGLVSIEENKGFRVATISEADIYDTYTIFTHIENIALKMAIENGDDKWEAAIVAQLHRLALIEIKEKTDSCTPWVEQNYNFHVALIAGCNSPLLLEIRHNIYMKFDRYCRIAYQFSKRVLPINYAEHKKLAAATIKRDIKEAQALMTYHINGAIETVIQHLKKNDLI